MPRTNPRSYLEQLKLGFDVHKQGVANDLQAKRTKVEKMSAFGLAKDALKIATMYLKRTNCEGWKDVLLTSPLFPKHFNLLLSQSSPDKNKDQKYPSELISSATKEIYELGAQQLPPILHHTGILAKYMSLAGDLPSVVSFQLCPEHNEQQKPRILKDICLSALLQIVNKSTRIIRTRLRWKMQEKKNRKLQRVSHQ